VPQENDPPNLLAWAGAAIGTLASAVALLWRLSRSDKDAVVLAQAERIKAAEERERQYIADREAAMESNIRQAQAQERTAEVLQAINGRLERIEHAQGRGP
jgi:hypothetical protein